MDVLLGTKVVAFRPKDDGSGKVGTVVLEDVATGAQEEHHPDGVFVFIGLDPNTGFLEGVVDLDERGFVVTDPAHMTSLPGVFAAATCARGRRSNSPAPSGRAPRWRSRSGPTCGRQTGDGRDGGVRMQPNEIFEPIIKADEKLKYSTAANTAKQAAAGAGRCSTRRATPRGRPATSARPAGRDEARGPRLAQSPSRGTRVRRTAFCSSVTCSSVSVPGRADRDRHLSEVRRAPVAAAEVGFEPAAASRPAQAPSR